MARARRLPVKLVVDTQQLKPLAVNARAVMNFRCRRKFDYGRKV